MSFGGSPPKPGQGDASCLTSPPKVWLRGWPGGHGWSCLACLAGKPRRQALLVEAGSGLIRTRVRGLGTAIPGRRERDAWRAEASSPAREASPGLRGLPWTQASRRLAASHPRRRCCALFGWRGDPSDNLHTSSARLSTCEGSCLTGRDSARRRSDFPFNGCGCLCGTASMDPSPVDPEPCSRRRDFFSCYTWVRSGCTSGLGWFSDPVHISARIPTEGAGERVGLAPK